MQAIVDIVREIWNIPYLFNGDVALLLFGENADFLVYFCVLYILMVFVVPEHVMKHREPFNLRVPFIFWNLGLCLFSVFGSLSCLELMAFLLNDRGFYKTTCFFDQTVIYSGRPAFWIFCFLLSKIPEMLDTAFLVLQKKPVIFLHWYHHLTVTIFCWHAGYTLIPSGLWFATMNYCVHSIMYFYYFVCACGMRKIIRPIAPLITMLQILQMVAGTFIVIYTAYHAYISGNGCAVDRISIRMGIAMYGSYFILFAILFSNLYLNKNNNNNKAKSAKDGKKNGVVEEDKKKSVKKD